MPARVAGQARAWKNAQQARFDLAQFPLHGRRVDRTPRRKRHNRQQRRVFAAGAVEGAHDLLIRRPALAPWHGESLFERFRGRSSGGHAHERHDDPEDDNEAFVRQDPASERCHVCFLLSSTAADQLLRARTRQAAARGHPGAGLDASGASSALCDSAHASSVATAPCPASRPRAGGFRETVAAVLGGGNGEDDVPAREREVCVRLAGAALQRRHGHVGEREEVALGGVQDIGDAAAVAVASER